VAGGALRFGPESLLVSRQSPGLFVVFGPPCFAIGPLGERAPNGALGTDLVLELLDVFTIPSLITPFEGALFGGACFTLAVFVLVKD